MEYNSHYLFPSTILVEKKPYKITTVLGSCISVCLYDPFTKTGGINHYMLPFWNGEGLASPKYGNIALEKLIEKMLANGCKIPNLQAKIFGGANLLTNNSGSLNIGKRNIDLAFNVLKEMKINISASNVGGVSGRKIIFNNYTGEVIHQVFHHPESGKP